MSDFNVGYKMHKIRLLPSCKGGGSVAEWLACWTQAQKARVQIAASTLSGNSLRQTVYTHRASVHQAAKIGSSPEFTLGY